MFILADAGMGKTSLLLMLKLGHLLSFWPKGYDCLLLKLGADTLERLDKHPNQPPIPCCCWTPWTRTRRRAGASAIEDLLASERRDWTAYGVYEAMVKAWLLREIGKFAQNPEIAPPSLEYLWAACRLIAIYLQALNKRELSEDELKQLIAAQPKVAHIPHLNFGGRSLLNRNSDKDYRFAHYSIQEFLVTNALCEKESIYELAKRIP
jgi:hypothetical protein